LLLCIKALCLRLWAVAGEWTNAVPSNLKEGTEGRAALLIFLLLRSVDHASAFCTGINLYCATRHGGAQQICICSWRVMEWQHLPMQKTFAGMIFRGACTREKIDWGMYRWFNTHQIHAGS
jgi:hypothetical protein